MPPTDTSEHGLESIIVASLTGLPLSLVTGTPEAAERQASYGGAGYVLGDPKDYDRDHALDWPKLLAFLQATQPKVVEQLGLAEPGPKRTAFLARVQGEITKRGVVSVLRRGIKHGPATIDLFYGSPSPANARAQEQFQANIFSVTRQLAYSRDATKLALDLAAVYQRPASSYSRTKEPPYQANDG